MKKRLLYIDLIKILSILLVLFLHGAASFIYDVKVNTIDFNILNLFDSITRLAVPLFFMVSGSYFLNNKNKVTIKSIFKKNIFKILLVLVISSLTIELTKHLISPDYLSFNEFIKRVILGDKILWFFYALIGLYLITPLLREITKSKEKTQYFIFLYFLFTVLIPFCLYFIKNDLFETLFEQLSISIFKGYIGYYVIGFYLSKYKLSNLKKNILYALGFIGFIMTYSLTKYYSIKSGQLVTYFYDYNSLNVFFYSIGTFILIKSSCKDKKHNNKFIKCFSTLTIFIYPVHRLLMIIVNEYFNFKISNNYLYMIPLYFLIIALSSFIISFIIYLIVSFLKKNSLLFYSFYVILLFIIVFAFLFNLKSEEKIYRDALKVPVLTYHRVVNDNIKYKYFKNNEWVHAKTDFDEQMKYLYENNYNFLSLDEFYCWYNKKCKIPQKSVLITFDDGDIEAYYNVMPILKKYNLKGVIFIIGSKTLEDVSRKNEVQKAYLSSSLIDKIKNEYPKFEVQSHSYDLHKRVKHNKKKIQTITKQALINDFKNNEKFGFEYLAYPYGVYSEDVFEVLESFNYKLAFKFKNFRCATRNDPKYLISRIKINGQMSLDDFIKHLNMC